MNDPHTTSQPEYKPSTTNSTPTTTTTLAWSRRDGWVAVVHISLYSNSIAGVWTDKGNYSHGLSAIKSKFDRYTERYLPGCPQTTYSQRKRSDTRLYMGPNNLYTDALELSRRRVGNIYVQCWWFFQTPQQNISLTGNTETLLFSNMVWMIQQHSNSSKVKKSFQQVSIRMPKLAAVIKKKASSWMESDDVLNDQHSFQWPGEGVQYLYTRICLTVSSAVSPFAFLSGCASNTLIQS